MKADRRTARSGALTRGFGPRSPMDRFYNKDLAQGNVRIEPTDKPSENR